ncbi:FecR family protein [Pseudomonas sp.]|uniref:FecR family protein n=1 Tax=Pseudomonas sp. TaxID=306 RepID=UPI0028AC609F|nr:FecR family protein [Pseudomonas sp.]
MTSQDMREQEIREAAALWVVRLGAGELSAEDAEALRVWREQDPRHAQALAFADETWSALGQLGALPVVPAAPFVTPPPAMPVRRPRRLLRRMAIAASLLLVLGLGVEQGQQMFLPLLADQSTGTGEIRSLRLADGSLVELDAQSAIDLAYSDSERRVRLLKGDAYFHPAPVSAAEPRPFVVESTGGSSRALGTQFVVGLRGEGAWTGVLEHSVGVSLDDEPRDGPRERVLQQGQSARYDAEHGVQPLQIDLQRATAWRRGTLVFEAVPLAQVVEQINRYRPGRLVIADADLAQREVNGMFRLDSLERALDTLSTELGAKRLDLLGLTVIY